MLLGNSLFINTNQKHGVPQNLTNYYPKIISFGVDPKFKMKPQLTLQTPLEIPSQEISDYLKITPFLFSYLDLLIKIQIMSHFSNFYKKIFKKPFKFKSSTLSI